jgi:flavin-dependent dehydrogenase
MGQIPDLNCDVAIVGGGPAGVSAAIALRRNGLAVVLLEATRYEGTRFGEAVAPVVRPVITRLGITMPAEIWAVPSFANESAWGSAGLSARPFVFDPYGGGICVDRARFDASLADAASENGATVLPQARVTKCEYRSDRSWQLRTEDIEIRAAAVICATGRGAGLARALGARRQTVDQLVGVAVEYDSTEYGDPGGSTIVEAARDGWWYSTRLPAGQIVVFMTDADICRDRGYHVPVAWDEAVAATRHIRERVAGLLPVARPRITSAMSQRLDRTRVPGRWLAAGDTAMSVDPLTGRGILHALLSGEAAGTAMVHWLLDDDTQAIAYDTWLDVRFTEYCRTRLDYYALESRWPDSRFWRRRSATAANVH